MSDKPKVAFYWCSSCGGCEEAVVDLAEQILDVVAAVDIVFWPVAMDFKKSDVEAMEDGSILAAFVNGAIRTTEFCLSNRSPRPWQQTRRFYHCSIGYGRHRSCLPIAGDRSSASSASSAVPWRFQYCR